MAIGTSQAFRTQNLRLLGNLFDKNNFLGKKGYYLNSTGDGVDWKADLNESSGIFYGGIISATIGGTTFNISAGSGQLLTRALVNNEVVTTNKIVSWNTQSNVSLTYRTTHQFSYLYIDENGVLQQQNTSFTDAEYQNKIIIGVICHINYSTINLVSNKQNIAYGDSHRIYEFANSFGPIKRSGLSVSAYSTNLRITRAAGSVFSIGCNYANDQFDADSPSISAANPALLCRVYRNGGGAFVFDVNSGSYYTDIDPNKYDDGSGTLQTVNNNQWTIQRLFFFPNNPNDVITYYGRAIYNSYNDAIAAISTEAFSEATITSENAIFLGYLVIRGGAANLSLSGDGVFFQSGAFRNVGAISGGGGGGGGATTLDDLTDVLISSVAGGQFLTYDSSTSLWKNRSYILDANNNELIKFPSIVTNAVNEVTISNTATSGSPSISATGDDTNIGLNLISKGTGSVQINGKAISLANSFTTSGNYSLTFTTTGSTNLTLPTSGTLATTSQIPTVYDNTLTLAGSGGISLSAIPTFTANASADKTITISIADGALAISKLADITTLRILGRTSGSTGPVEQLDGTGVVAVIGSSAVSRAVNLGGGIAGQIPYQSGANTTAFSAAGSLNQVLLSGGSGAPTWANQSSLSVGSATTAGSVANALTISSPLTGTSYNGSAAISIGLQDASATQAGGVSIGAQTFAGNKTFKDNVIVSGNLTVNGTTVTINSSTLSVDDKNIELGSVVAIPSLSSTVNIDAGDTNVIVSSTNGLIVGQALTKISGTGAFGVNPVISSITSATQFTVSPVHATSGSIIFSVGGATDVTADGGGITLKGATDKTFNWINATSSWTSSENLDLASGKTYKINNVAVLSSTTLGSSVVNSSLTSVGTLANLTVTNVITGSVSGSAGSLSGTYTFWGQNFNGTQNVSGNLTSVGNITGSSGITITAGGSNQNITLTPSGTGYTLLNGSVGIGNSTPNNKLTIQAGDNKDSGPIINLGGNAINQFESGRIRFTEVTTGAAPFYQGAYLHYDGSNNLFHIGVHDSADSLIASDINAISIVRSSGNIGIGTTNPVAKLSVYTTSPHSSPTGISVAAGTSGANLLARDSSSYHNWFPFTDGNNYYSAVGHIFRSSDHLTNYVYINNSGNVGIGNSTPNNKLAVSGSVNIGSNYNTAAPTNGLIVEGNVGIGISSPLSKLHLVGSHVSGSGFIRFEASDFPIISLKAPATGDGSAGYWGFRAQDTSNNDLMFYGYRYTSAFSGFWIDPDFGSNIAKGFFVKRSDGNVGIGINTPNARLHINSATSGATLLRADGTNGTLFSVVDDLSDSLMSVNNSAGLPMLEVFADDRIVAGQYGQNDFVLVNNKLGLGTNNPQYKLDVNGTLNVSGNTSLSTISITGTITSSATEAVRINNNNGFVSFYNTAGSSRTGYLQGNTGNSVLLASENNAIIQFAVGGTIRATISSSGDVGIGTVAPTSQSNYRFLQVNGTNSAIIETMVGDTRIGGFDSDASNLYVGTIGAFPIVFRTSVNEKWRITNAGVFQSNGAQTIQTSTGNLTLATAAGNGHILLSPHGTGNIGIGTANPSQLLHISSAATAKLKITADTDNVDENDLGGIEISQDGGITTSYFGHDNLNNLILGVNSTTGPNIYIGTRTDGTNFVSSGDAKVTILNGGSVGIGTTTPSSLLQIGALSPTSATNGIQFGDDTGTRIYRSASGIVSCSGTIAATFSGNLTGNVTGNASTATTLQTARNINGTSFNGSADITTSSWGTARTLTIGSTGKSVDGSAAVSWSLAEIGAAATNQTMFIGTTSVAINRTSGSLSLTGVNIDGSSGSCTGNAANVTGTVAIANGGTGAATTTANAFFVGPNGSAGAPSFRVMATADIPNSIVTFAKLQDVAGPTLVGRLSATSGPVAPLSSANARTAIGATTVGSNLITLADPGAITFPRINADNTVSALDAATFRTAIGAGTGSGTVTSVTGTAPIASSGGTTPAISLNDAGVTFAKIQNISSGTVIGRTAAGTGVSSEIDGAGIASIISTNAVANSTNAANVTIATDDATNSSYYLYFGANASGNTPLKASTKIRYNPNSGAFSATTKSFRIPHPTKSQYDLVYGSLESPYHGIRLTGKGKTKGNRAEITLPDYINVLVDKETVNIQLTVIKCAKILYIDDIIIDDNKFIVKYDKSWFEKSKDIEFYWDFTAERKDVPKLIVEEKI